MSVCLCNRYLFDRERTILQAGRVHPYVLMRSGSTPFARRGRAGYCQGRFWGPARKPSSNVRYAHIQGVSMMRPQYIQILGMNSPFRWRDIVDIFAFCSPILFSCFPDQKAQSSSWFSARAATKIFRRPCRVCRRSRSRQDVRFVMSIGAICRQRCSSAGSRT